MKCTLICSPDFCQQALPKPFDLADLDAILAAFVAAQTAEKKAAEEKQKEEEEEDQYVHRATIGSRWPQPGPGLLGDPIPVPVPISIPTLAQPGGNKSTTNKEQQKKQAASSIDVGKLRILVVDDSKATR